jgi:hypothetical protein
MVSNKIKAIGATALGAVAVGSAFAGGLDNFPTVFDNKDVKIVYGDDAKRSDKVEAYQFKDTVERMADANRKVEIRYVDEQLYLNDNYESNDIKETHVAELFADEVADDLEAKGYAILSKQNERWSDVDFDSLRLEVDNDVFSNEDTIVVGGPAVNEVSAELLGLPYPTYGNASGVSEGEFVIRYFAEENSVLIYGYGAEDTKRALEHFEEYGIQGNYYKGE